MKSTLKPESGKLRILQINSMLTGGGTDDQCVKLAAALHGLGQEVLLAGPGGRAFARNHQPFPGSRFLTREMRRRK
jgi:hypothetical protein